MFTFGLMAQILIYASIGFLTPTLAIHLKQYEMDMFWIGVFFSLPAVMYIVGSLLIPCYLSIMGRRGVIFSAFVLLILGVFMIGTSPVLRFPDSPKMIFAGLLLVGLAAAAITIPVLPEMLEQIINKHPILENNQELNDIAAGYFNGCLGVGEAIGPIVASVLTAGIGFRTSCDAFAVVLFAYTIFFFCFNGRCQIFHLKYDDEGSQTANEGWSSDSMEEKKNDEDDDDYKRAFEPSPISVHSGCKSEHGLDNFSRFKK